MPSKLTLATAVATLGLALLPNTALATDVCNEAENSHRGGYTVNGGPVDPNPPAFLRGSQMRVGNGNGKGLVNASYRSPALRTCGPTEVVPPTPTEPTDPPGDDDPIMAT
jgi:hypothetical protein